MTKTTKSTKTETPVVVTTAHRGVFFGYLVGEPTPEKVRLERARNCISWTAQLRGVVGLAATGPGHGCRVGPAAPVMTLYGITSVMEASPEAAAAWESGPWS